MTTITIYVETLHTNVANLHLINSCAMLLFRIETTRSV